jgi:hypothetical protein
MRGPLVLVAAAAVAVIAFLIVRGSSDRPDDMVRNEAALAWTVRAAGALVAAVAAFALLVRALGGAPTGRLVGLVLPLLGGVLLSAGHWAVAVTLGAVAVAALAVRWAGRRPATAEAPRSAG